MSAKPTLTALFKVAVAFSANCERKYSGDEVMNEKLATVLTKEQDRHISDLFEIMYHNPDETAVAILMKQPVEDDAVVPDLLAEAFIEATEILTAAALKVEDEAALAALMPESARNPETARAFATISSPVLAKLCALNY